MSVWNYVEARLKVFGLHGADANGNCLCGNPECDAAFKHPLISAWQHTPDWSDEQLEVMEMTGQFKTGFGVIVDGLLVIDIDPRNGGEDSYKKLCIDTVTDYKKESAFVVATGGGGHHIYFKAPLDTRLKGKLDDYPGIDFKYSGFVVGAGSMHKSGNPYKTEKGHPDDIGEAPQVLVDLLTRQTYKFSDGDNFACSPDVTPAEISAMLGHISPDCDYEQWVSVGMAIHDATGGSGDQLWNDWSAGGKDYPGNEVIDMKWHSFGKTANPVTFGTIKKLAEDGGYKEPVTFETNLVMTGKETWAGKDPAKGDDIETVNKPSVVKGNHPVDISGVNLLKCTGLAGDLVDYINSNSRFPRENLAVAAALSSLGNIGGLNHVDLEYGVTSNQFILCVAGSATGKEAVQQSQSEIHRVAGLSQATYGGIKSEQEIVRNLLMNQPSFYSVDELGIFLQKIENARNKGGAAYLEGVIGMLMSAYSKANSRMLLSGDVCKEAKADLSKIIALCNKKISENDRPEENQRRADILTGVLKQLIDGGLYKPFLSLIGYTTPVTFNSIVSYENATNGFIGRSLIIEEKETNPRAKRRFKPQEMSSVLQMKIASIASGGFSGNNVERIQFNGEQTEIKTSKEANEALDAIQDFFHNYAEHHKSATGLEAVVRRGFELVLKISFVLAIGHDDKTRALDDVTWAYALVRKDIDNKIKLAQSNIAEDSEEKGMALVAKLEAMLDYEVGMTEGQIKNRCRKFKPDDISSALEWMAKNKKSKKVKVPKEGNKKPHVIWLLK